MIISMIASLTLNHVIGKQNRIPWKQPLLDKIWFKFHTYDKPIIMGRKTFESIGKPLVNRFNIVLSNYHNIYKFRNRFDIIPAQTVLESLVLANYLGKGKEVFIIGGGEIYDIFMPHSHRLYLTYINGCLPGDVFFPFYSKKWQVTFCSNHNFDHEVNYNYVFKILEYI